jgi:SAM-dependent methyltransferase
MVDRSGEGDDGIVALNAKGVPSLIKAFCRDNSLYLASCLDIGCGRARKDRWFNRFYYSIEPRAYTGVETDPEILDELRDEGVDVRVPEDVREGRWDLCLALEVIEHVHQKGTSELLTLIRDRTEVVCAFTTPNIEYWEIGGTGRDNRNVLRLRPKDSVEDLRLIPDHVHQYDPGSGNPHTHKQLFTPESLRAVLSETFPMQEWGLSICRAWPWDIVDGVTGQKFKIFYKLFALAWRRDYVVDWAAG